MYNCLVNVGVPKDPELLADLFWIFDVNGDEMIDTKEYATIIRLFRTYSIDDKIKSRLNIISTSKASRLRQ